MEGKLEWREEEGRQGEGDPERRRGKAAGEARRAEKDDAMEERGRESLVGKRTKELSSQRGSHSHCTGRSSGSDSAADRVVHWTVGGQQAGIREEMQVEQRRQGASVRVRAPSSVGCFSRKRRLQFSWQQKAEKRCGSREIRDG